MKSQNLKNYYIPNNHTSTLQRPTSIRCKHCWVREISLVTVRLVPVGPVLRPLVVVKARGCLPFLHLGFRTNGVKHTARLAQADRMSGWRSMGATPKTPYKMRYQLWHQRPITRSSSRIGRLCCGQFFSISLKYREGSRLLQTVNTTGAFQPIYLHQHNSPKKCSSFFSGWLFNHGEGVQ